MPEHPENDQKLIEEVQKQKKIEIWRYIFLLMKALLTKRIHFEEEKSKIRCLRTQLNFIEGLIEFMEGLIVRKIIFLVNLGFNWNKLKFRGQIIILRVNLVKSRA